MTEVLLFHFWLISGFIFLVIFGFIFYFYFWLIRSVRLEIREVFHALFNRARETEK